MRKEKPRYFVRERSIQTIKDKKGYYSVGNNSTIHYFNSETLAKEFYDNKIEEFNENDIYQIKRNELTPAPYTYERIELVSPKEERETRREDIIIELGGNIQRFPIVA